MTLRNRIRRWWYWQQMARIDRYCRKNGHDDFGLLLRHGQYRG